MIQKAWQLRIAHLLHGCRTLGPGRRSVLWVAGCALRCPGCVAGPILGPEAGVWMPVEALAERLLASPDEGLTLSGGEPFEQAGPLAELCARLRAVRPWSFMAYTGLRWEALRERGDAQALLEQLDLLVDGPFVRAQRAELRWRGSRNQRVLLLSPRHADDPWRSEPDQSAGIEVHVSPEGQVFWAGVPPIGGALRGLRRRLVRHGVELHPTQEVWS